MQKSVLYMVLFIGNSFLVSAQGKFFGGNDDGYSGLSTPFFVLSVQFLDVKVLKQNNNVVIEWTVELQQNSSHYIIEKNSDGRNFISCGRVEAIHSTSLNYKYRFTDERPFYGLSFYRVAEVDINGHFVYSKTVSVQYQPEGLFKRIENPVRNNLVIQLKSTAGRENDYFILYDVTGRIVKKEKITGSIINTDVSALATGLYIVEIIMGDKKEQQKIIKTKL